MLITIVAGARPNFMKIAPIIVSIQQAQKVNKELKFRLVHTGQHYDKKMSGDFFRIRNLLHFPQNHFENQFVHLMVHDENHFIRKGGSLRL